MPRTLTALYASEADADAARERLISAGIPRSEIDIHDQAAYGDSAAPEHKRGMMAELKSFFSAHDDHQAYGEGLSRGHTLLSATVDDAETDRAIAVLEDSKAVDFDRSQEDWRASGWTGAPAAGVATDAGYAPDAVYAADTGYAERDLAARTGPAEDVIQVAEERLVVGKREVERGGVRVRSYIVETPVSEQVRLRDERVSIERRPVNRPLAAGDDAFRDRTVEMRETAEQAVVGKEAYIKEEIGLRKDVGERTEEINDTVRHTEVEVEDLGVDRDRRI